LNKFGPDAIVCGGYNYHASWRALSWAEAHDVGFVLWSESNIQDARSGRGWIERLKSNFLSRCDGFAVPGKSAHDYLLSLGVKAERITSAPNAVDNAWFAAHAESIRTRAPEFRHQLGLPDRFILFVGRLVEAKGVFDLLEAYGRLGDDVRSQVGLVFAGDGDCRPELERRAKRILQGKICFTGFVHREDLAALYALSETLLLPTHSDTWGLVVNEAMACGLPIVVTSVAGCAADLVENEWNGYVVLPGDPEALKVAIDHLAMRDKVRQQMSVRSYQRIRQYSPEACARGLAIAALTAERRAR